MGPLMIASAVMGVVGSMQAAESQAAAMEAQANAANYNAQVAQRNAGIAKEQAARDEEQQRRDARRQLGLMRASYGASGISMEGSPLDVLEDSAAQAELDAQNIKYKGELRALGYNDEATLDRYSANVSRSAAGRALNQGMWSSASAVLTSAGNYYSYKSSQNTTKALDLNESW